MKKIIHVISANLLVVVATVSLTSQTSFQNKSGKNIIFGGTQVEQRNNVGIDSPSNKSENAQTDNNSIKSGIIKLDSENEGNDVKVAKSHKNLKWLVEHLSGRKYDSTEYHLRYGQEVARSIIDRGYLTKLIKNRRFFIYVEYGPDLRPIEYCVIIRDKDVLQIVWNWYEMPNSEKHFCFPSDNNALIDAFDILQTLNGSHHILEAEIGGSPEYTPKYKLVWTQPSGVWNHAYFAFFDENYKIKIDWIDNAIVDINHWDYFDALYLFNEYIKGFIYSCWKGSYRSPIEIHY